MIYLYGARVDSDCSIIWVLLFSFFSFWFLIQKEKRNIAMTIMILRYKKWLTSRICLHSFFFFFFLLQIPMQFLNQVEGTVRCARGIYHSQQKGQCTSRLLHCLLLFFLADTYFTIIACSLSLPKIKPKIHLAFLVPSVRIRSHLILLSLIFRSFRYICCCSCCNY